MPDDRPIEDSPPIGEAQTDQTEGGCPAGFGRVKPPVEGGGNRDWWPNQLNLRILQKNPDVINPLDPGFDYVAAVQTIDVDALAERDAWRASGVDDYPLTLDLRRRTPPRWGRG